MHQTYPIAACFTCSLYQTTPNLPWRFIPLCILYASIQPVGAIDLEPLRRRYTVHDKGTRLSCLQPSPMGNDLLM